MPIPTTGITPSITPYIVCILYAFILHPILDRWLGKPLSQKVEVRERRFVAAHSYYTGKTYSHRSDAWSLGVANEQGEGWVRVSQKLYDSVQESDTVFVKGKQGRFSGRWYLEEASKKLPQKR